MLPQRNTVSDLLGCVCVCVCVSVCICVCLCVSPSVVRLCKPIDYSLPGPSVHGILQARILEWIAILFLRDLPNPGIKSGYPALQSDFLPTEPPRKLPVRKLSVRKALIKKTTNNNCWLACEKKKGPLCDVGGNINWYSHYRKQCGGSSKY